MQLFWRLVVQHVQEMSRDAIVVGLCLDTHAVRMEAVPVKQHGRQAGEQSIGHVSLVRKITFGLNVAEKRYACAQHIHGVRVAGHHFKHRSQRCGQTA